MRSFFTAVGLSLLLATSACFTSAPSTLVSGGYDKAEMQAAQERARSEVDQFVVVMSQGAGENFAVKAPVRDGEKVEHFWLTGLTYTDGVFTGTINNDPGAVSNVKLGDPRSVPRGEISDWMYMKDGKIHGNYTMRPLLKTLPPDEAAAYRSLLAEP